MTSTTRSSATLVALLALSGCARVMREPVTLPTFARPVLTPVSATALQCLAPETYTTIINRERAYKDWGMQYEAAVKANNARARTRQQARKSGINRFASH